MRRILLTVVFLGILPLAPLAQEAADPPAAHQALPAITVSTVGKRVMRDRVIASGLVGAVELVQVQPLIEGQPIETLEAEVGDFVAEGEVLARLSVSTLELQKSQFNAALTSAKATIAQAEAQVLEAQASADEAQRVNQRTAQLRQQGAASQAAADTAQAAAISANARVMVARQTLAAARAQVLLAEAQLANIELQRERTNVVAPVAGEIVERNAKIGAIASAQGEPMFTLLRDSALELFADVAEQDLIRLKPGQPVLIRTLGAEEPIQGAVRLVEPAIDTDTRLGRARIGIEKMERVRSGMFAEAEILIAERETLVVPITAVGAGPEGSTVMRVQDGLVERKRVETGIRDAGMVEIVEGLAPGDLVVTKAAAFVRPGDRINPVPAEPVN
ncbi:efflux RND transporter periplasmic adaptor subunit [Cereibacter sphaeroides]|uniref:efflux RND transporter periplasmic adaptor subunit n=1 Tax=Cereibacter sphaeroides TaxID=1063 RepID=UPI001F19F504|nr:efflux RND transporter periplasmic adaptor subunit [Cereibacter sphaeroides]MCE6970912.1 efflux RND transporter periplasmic adaptor subunit [Cereibacter sphaeroides]